MAHSDRQGTASPSRPPISPTTTPAADTASPCPLARRRAVSYRNHRPYIAGTPRPERDRTTTNPVRTVPEDLESPPKQRSSLPKDVFSFCEEEFTSSPINEERLPAETPPDSPTGLPSLPVEQPRRRPRGLSVAIAQACRNFEPERRENTGSLPKGPVKKRIVQQPELSSSPQVSLGSGDLRTRRPSLSEVGAGKRPASEEPQQDPSHLSGDMDLLRPESAMAMTGHRREAVRLAQKQEAAVVEKCKRSGSAAPGYSFDELIGKGSFGRVYKGRQTSSQKVVAIKVIDIDDTDFRAFGDQKDEQINDFNKEIRILRQAQESGAPNLNQMIEALPVHSQLWLICEYCPGGSVKTLMRATNDRLGERYILVMARELSKALKGLHDAGIMHRDIKAANVLIHEEGRLQLCDFGVATVLDKKTDKRRTFIGTPHWMPPELWDKDPEYSDEVDVWAFGCTLYECAVGKPPNADVREPHQIRSRMRRLNQSIELPDNNDDHYSPGLRSLVAYTLTPNAAARPSFSDVLAHEYIANTDETHPTAILSELVQVYYGWLYGGGQRASLFMPGGAVAGDAPETLGTSDEEWNFSATDHFEKRMSTVLNIPDLSDLPDSQHTEGEKTPRAQKNTASGDFTAEEKANFEERVRRGADLSNIFDPNKPEYEYVTKMDFIPIQQRRVSDLPLRAMSEERPYSIANQVIDLGDFDSSNYAVVSLAKDEKIKLADAATIKANRGNSKSSSDATASENLFMKPSIFVSEAPNVLDDGSRSAAQGLSTSSEWSDQDQPNVEAEITGPSRAKDAAKHKTMEWSFESAMSEAQTEYEKPSPIPEEDDETSKSNSKHATMQWSFSTAMAEASEATFTSTTTPQQPKPPQQTSRRVPPPLIRSMTEPVGTDFVQQPPSPSDSSSITLQDEIDPFALDNDNMATGHPPAIASALDERGISSFYGRADADVLYRLGGDHLPVADGEEDDEEGKEEEEQEEEEEEEEEERAEVSMPAVYAVDPRVLDAEAPSSTLEGELERLLADMQGVLGGARAAVATGRRGRGRGRGKGRKEGWGKEVAGELSGSSGEGESEWEDEDEE